MTPLTTATRQPSVDRSKAARPARRAGDGPRFRGSLIEKGAAVSIAAMELSERERAILDFEGSWWTEPGPKEDAIKARFGLSATRYYQIVAGLVDRGEAEEYQPLVVRRARRSRDRRRRARFEGPQADRGYQR
jgi:hypothetical protein